MFTNDQTFSDPKPLNNEESYKKSLFEKEEPESSRRILVVDDDPWIRDILSGIVSSMGYEVDVANNGDTGLDMFMKTPFDLVITDLNMPGVDGFTLAARIKAKYPDVMVVLVTGEERDFVLNRVENSYVDIVLFKPFKLKDIQKTVKRMLDSRLLVKGITNIESLKE